MGETTIPTRLELARLRAEGVGRIDLSATPRLQAGAARAGRSLAFSRLGADPVALFGWAPGAEPLDDYPRSSPSRLLVHTFTACLGTCWRHRDAHPWPGLPVPEADVIAALAEARGEEMSPAVLGKVRSAMVLLRASMWLDPTVFTVQMGPRVAAWCEEQVDVLREAFDRMPRLRGDRSGAE